jgi:hypothetical protein
MSDERYVRNCVDVLYQSDFSAGEKLNSPPPSRIDGSFSQERVE